MVRNNNNNARPQPFAQLRDKDIPYPANKKEHKNRSHLHDKVKDECSRFLQEHINAGNEINKKQKIKTRIYKNLTLRGYKFVHGKPGEYRDMDSKHIHKQLNNIINNLLKEPQYAHLRNQRQQHQQRLQQVKKARDIIKAGGGARAPGNGQSVQIHIHESGSNHVDVAEGANYFAEGANYFAAGAIVRFSGHRRSLSQDTGRRDVDGGSSNRTTGSSHDGRGGNRRRSLSNGEDLNDIVGDVDNDDDDEDNVFNLLDDDDEDDEARNGESGPTSSPTGSDTTSTGHGQGRRNNGSSPSPRRSSSPSRRRSNDSGPRRSSAAVAARTSRTADGTHEDSNDGGGKPSAKRTVPGGAVTQAKGGVVGARKGPPPVNALDALEIDPDSEIVVTKSDEEREPEFCLTLTHKGSSNSDPIAFKIRYTTGEAFTVLLDDFSDTSGLIGPGESRKVGLFMQFHDGTLDDLEGIELLVYGKSVDRSQARGDEKKVVADVLENFEEYFLKEVPIRVLEVGDNGNGSN